LRRSAKTDEDTRRRKHPCYENNSKKLLKLTKLLKMEQLLYNQEHDFVHPPRRVLYGNVYGVIHPNSVVHSLHQEQRLQPLLLEEQMQQQQ
jgi:hypothetical protein